MGMPKEPPVSSLVQFLQEEINDNLRSVIHYDKDGYEVVYIQDDVAAEYTGDEIEKVIQDLGMEAFSKPLQESLYAHGELRCTMRWFEDGIELNFLVSDSEGVAIGLSGETFIAHQTFLGKCMAHVQDSIE